MSPKIRFFLFSPLELWFQKLLSLLDCLLDCILPLLLACLLPILLGPLPWALSFGLLLVSPPWFPPSFPAGIPQNTFRKLASRLKSCNLASAFRHSFLTLSQMKLVGLDPGSQISQDNIITRQGTRQTAGE